MNIQEHCQTMFRAFRPVQFQGRHFSKINRLNHIHSINSQSYFVHFFSRCHDDYRLASTGIINFSLYPCILLHKYVHVIIFLLYLTLYMFFDQVNLTYKG